ncbi:MAG: DUF4097 family beta strand repeat-containing protein [Pyrinomonadaceae bacterium]
MSWLYSIVFAGLLLSTNGTDPRPAVSNFAAEKSAVFLTKQDETEKFEQTYPLSANGRISVSNVNGSIVVEAWDRGEVKLEATKIGDSRETLADVDIKVDARPDYLSVEADYGSWKRDRDGAWKNNRWIEVQFHLMVPRNAVLNEVQTVNGSVTVSNFTNYTKISAVNGDVSATNLSGTSELSTVNGKVIADFDRLDNAGRIALSTVNGSVSLVIPSDSNATIKADSLNGEISNGFGLPVRKGKYIGRDLHGRLGDGRIQIKLNSVNGPLEIKHRSDGRPISPATNLLQQAKAGDEDWDDENSAMPKVDKLKIERDAARAMRDSDRATKDAMKEAQKEIANIAPAIAKIDLSNIKVDIDPRKIQDEIRSSVLPRVAVAMDEIRWQGNAPTIQKKGNTFKVKSSPKVTIDAKGCAVSISSWDKQEVQYVLTEFSGSRDHAPVTVEESAGDSSVTLRVPNLQRSHSGAFPGVGQSRVHIDIFVPKKSNIKVMTDEEIRLEGVTGDIELNGEDESINVRDVEGSLKLLSGDAEVRILGFNGDIDSTIGDGELFLEGSFRKIASKAKDGHVTLTIPANANMTIASNIEVESDGVELKESGDHLWQLGSGSPRSNFHFSDGRLTVRNSSLLSNY